MDSLIRYALADLRRMVVVPYRMMDGLVRDFVVADDGQVVVLRKDGRIVKGVNENILQKEVNAEFWSYLEGVGSSYLVSAFMKETGKSVLLYIDEALRVLSKVEFLDQSSFLLTSGVDILHRSLPQALVCGCHHRHLLHFVHGLVPQSRCSPSAGLEYRTCRPKPFHAMLSEAGRSRRVHARTAQVAAAHPH